MDSPSKYWSYWIVHILMVFTLSNLLLLKFTLELLGLECINVSITPMETLV